MLYVSTLIYNSVVLPIRVSLIMLKALLRIKKQRVFTVRQEADIARVLVIVLSTLITIEVTKPSALYHWMRSQTDYKLIFIKQVFEILHTMLTQIGVLIMQNFSREFQMTETSEAIVSKNYHRTKAVLSLLVYAVMHSVVLTYEMLIIHVVLTLESQTQFAFVFINCLGEVKLSAFKKCDYNGLFEYANADAADRVHTVLYILFTLIQTS